MKLVVKLKLETSSETGPLLRETTEQYRSVCNHLSGIAFSKRVFDRYDLQDLAYQDCRGRFSFPSQLVVRAIAEVCSGYKTLLTQIKNHNGCCKPEDHRELTQIEFSPNLAIPYDQRVLSYNMDESVS